MLLIRNTAIAQRPTYIARLTQSPGDVRRAQRLRFEVFNLELNEGLAESHFTGLDVDPFDDVCDHLIVEHIATGEVVGTYRLHSGATAAANHGYYSEREFDFAPYERLRREIIELGRACVHAEHRNLPVLHRLWRGIAQYAGEHHARLLIGCSSLTSQKPLEGAAMYEELRIKHLVRRQLRTHPQEQFTIGAGMSHPGRSRDAAAGQPGSSAFVELRRGRPIPAATLSIVRAFAFVFFSLCALAEILLTVPFVRREDRRVTRTLWLHRWCRFACRVLGIRLTIRGSVPDSGLLACNHLSYLDIIVLSSIRPCVFVAKKDVAAWPLFGWLARAAGTIFVDRRRKFAARAVVDLMRQAIADGALVVPLIDAKYRTLIGPSYTAAMGSSLGGVVSFYLGWQWPEVFGKIACLSSTFTFRDNLIERVLSEEKRNIRIYLDSGWPGDNYEATRSMRDRLIWKGYLPRSELFYLAFPEAKHDENAWAARSPIPFQFLFGRLPAFAESANSQN